LQNVSANAKTKMTIEEIIKFLKDNVEPIPDSSYGQGFRASAYLTDGTFLPCVMFRNPSTVIDLAIRRFKEEQSGKSIFSKSSGMGYREIVKTFVTSGNCVNYYDIERVEKSKNAFPLNILGQIEGETTMSWTGFVLKMKDNRCFGFGTRFQNDFFHIPDNYSTDDIAEVINHSYISQTGEVCSHEVPFMDWPKDYNDKVVFRERQYFVCYVDNL
jgi:hypothetical protein